MAATPPNGGYEPCSYNTSMLQAPQACVTRIDRGRTEEALMTSASDAAIARQVSELLTDAGIPMDVSVTDGVVQLTGLVSSPRLHQAALDIARSISGVRQVDDEIEYEVI